MANELQDRNIAILLAPRGTEQAEFEKPRQAIEEAVGHVKVIGLETGEAQTVNGDLDPGGRFQVEKPFYDACTSDYDALVVPGGSVGSDRLRADDEAVRFI